MTQMSITYVTESPNTLIRSSRWNQNFNDIKNFINGNQIDDTDNIKAGGITNTAIASNASISSSKLNLATISQVISLSSVIFKNAQGANVSSATTTTLGEDGNFFFITGTTTITSITAKQAGTVVFLKFNGILTLTNGSNLKLLSNFVTVAGDTIILVSDGTNWWEMSRLKSDGSGFENLANIPSGAGVIPSANVPSVSRSQLFISSGTFTAPSGITKVYLTMASGGGGGGGGQDGANKGGGGGAGGRSVINYPYTVVAGNSYTVTIAAGGTAGTNNANDAGTGGTTTFDAFSLTGGSPGGGAVGGGGTGGAAGSSSSGSTQTAGAVGIPGGGGGNGAVSTGGGSGATLFGAGKTGANAGIGGATGDANTGVGGAGGGGNSGQNGGAGGTGICLVSW